MKDMVQSHMAPARGATTMTRMHWLAKPYHGSGRACPCHVSPTYSPTSRIRHQYPCGGNMMHLRRGRMQCPIHCAPTHHPQGWRPNGDIAREVAPAHLQMCRKIQNCEDEGIRDNEYTVTRCESIGERTILHTIIQ